MNPHNQPSDRDFKKHRRFEVVRVFCRPVGAVGNRLQARVIWAASPTYSRNILRASFAGRTTTMRLDRKPKWVDLDMVANEASLL